MLFFIYISFVWRATGAHFSGFPSVFVVLILFSEEFEEPGLCSCLQRKAVKQKTTAGPWPIFHAFPHAITGKTINLHPSERFPNIPKCASGKVLFSNDQYCHKFDKKRSWQDLTIMLTFWFSVTSPKRPSPGTGKWQITTACPDSHVLSMERCAHLLTLTGLLQLHIDHVVGCSFWLFPSFVPKDWTHSTPYLFNRRGSVTMRHRKLSESS